jgi:hypothetical protein
VIRLANISRLWKANIAIFILILLGSILVDGNGRLPGLTEELSSVIAVVLFGLGVLMDLLLGWVDRKKWPIVFGIAIVYVFMAIPAFAWW